jgi:hypothetical protein
MAIIREVLYQYIKGESERKISRCQSSAIMGYVIVGSVQISV